MLSKSIFAPYKEDVKAEKPKGKTGAKEKQAKIPASKIKLLDYLTLKNQIGIDTSDSLAHLSQQIETELKQKTIDQLATQVVEQLLSDANIKLNETAYKIELQDLFKKLAIEPNNAQQILKEIHHTYNKYEFLNRLNQIAENANQQKGPLTNYVDQIIAEHKSNNGNQYQLTNLRRTLSLPFLEGFKENFEENLAKGSRATTQTLKRAINHLKDKLAGYIDLDEESLIFLLQDPDQSQSIFDSAQSYTKIIELPLTLKKYRILKEGYTDLHNKLNKELGQKNNISRLELKSLAKLPVYQLHAFSTGNIKPLGLNADKVKQYQTVAKFLIKCLKPSIKHADQILGEKLSKGELLGKRFSNLQAPQIQALRDKNILTAGAMSLEQIITIHYGKDTEPDFWNIVCRNFPSMVRGFQVTSHLMSSINPFKDPTTTSKFKIQGLRGGQKNLPKMASLIPTDLLKYGKTLTNFQNHNNYQKIFKSTTGLGPKQVGQAIGLTSQITKDANKAYQELNKLMKAAEKNFRTGKLNLNQVTKQRAAYKKAIEGLADLVERNSNTTKNLFQKISQKHISHKVLLDTVEKTSAGIGGSIKRFFGMFKSPTVIGGILGGIQAYNKKNASLLSVAGAAADGAVFCIPFVGSLVQIAQLFRDKTLFGNQELTWNQKLTNAGLSVGFDILTLLTGPAGIAMRVSALSGAKAGTRLASGLTKQAGLINIGRAVKAKKLDLTTRSLSKSPLILGSAVAGTTLLAAAPTALYLSSSKSYSEQWKEYKDLFSPSTASKIASTTTKWHEQRVNMPIANQIANQFSKQLEKDLI